MGTTERSQTVNHLLNIRAEKDLLVSLDDGILGNKTNFCCVFIVTGSIFIPNSVVHSKLEIDKLTYFDE